MGIDLSIFYRASVKALGSCIRTEQTCELWSRSQQVRLFCELFCTVDNIDCITKNVDDVGEWNAQSSSSSLFVQSQYKEMIQKL